MNSNERLIKMKPSSNFLLAILTKIVKTIKENGESYKIRDAGEHYVCYTWSNARLCASVVKKQNTRNDYVVYINFSPYDAANTNLMIDTEARTVKSHSTILSFLTKKPKTAPFILKSLDGLKEFIDEVIEAVPIEDDTK
ncbi:MAG: hypothetical protein QW578_08520, partial [Thermoplasmatales archaeon]